MSQYIFPGCYTALITPFQNDQVDYDSLGKIVEQQIAGGVDGIVAVGTTGESPTLEEHDHIEVIRFIAKKVAGRCKVIAGTGANSTAEAVRLTKEAATIEGVNGTLQVTPYYNKPTQEGLFKHFTAVADATDLPIILYNVPGRAGVPIELDTVKRLAEHKNIVSIKEAAGSVDRVSQVLRNCDIEVVSGDDALTLPMMSVGAVGVISVLSNVLPAEITQLTHAALENDWAKVREIHYKYYNLMNDMFIETNPVPVKTAMALLGFCSEELRLPLCEMEAANKEVLVNSLKEAGVIS